MEVTVLSRKLIKPSTPTPNHLRTYKLSFFDQLAPPSHWPIVFFYPVEGTDDEKANSKERLQQLENSLPETLALFYPLAGRFVKEDLLVDCNDQGVEYFEAKANARLMEFLREGPKVDFPNHFVHFGHIGAANLATTPMVVIQVTAFECGGLALGVLSSHVIADGFTAATFIQAWATASRLGIEKVIPPSFGLSSLFPSRDVSAVLKLPPPKKSHGDKVITRRFLFDAATISALKARVTKPHDPTRLEVVISTIWKALIFAAKAKHQGQLRSSVMSQSMNLRGRTGLPAPENSCGNLYMECPARFVAEEIDNTELINHLVGILRGSVRSTLASCAKLSHGDEVFSMVIDGFNEAGEAAHDEKIDVHHFSSMCRFPVYETDFGWGKPFLVTFVSLPVELVNLIDTKCGRGIEAWVSLIESDMLELEKDPDILALTTSSSK